jgi:hypothetical protein
LPKRLRGERCGCVIELGLSISRIWHWYQVAHRRSDWPRCAHSRLRCAARNSPRSEIPHFLPVL